MPRFFIDSPCEPGGLVTVAGEDARHIAKSLRMREGEPLDLCDGLGTDYHCEIDSLSPDAVTVRVLSAQPSRTEPRTLVTLIQSLPKADKMDFVMQKAVEMGASRMVPMLSARCISRPDAKAAAKKTERWQKIASEAAKQCGRGILPQVAPVTEFRRAVEDAARDGEVILFYEGGGAPLTELVSEKTERLSILIGPEGGFAPEEVELAKSLGAKTATLGPRILRTETAPVAALAAIMLLTGNLAD